MLKEKIKNISFGEILLYVLGGVGILMGIFGIVDSISTATEPTTEISGTVTRMSCRSVMIDDGQTLLINSNDDPTCELLKEGDKVKISYGEKTLHTHNCEILK